jgi:hypothetical protein
VLDAFRLVADDAVVDELVNQKTIRVDRNKELRFYEEELLFV